jgi:drug/metabolite transporter (DMT)-like permease
MAVGTSGMIQEGMVPQAREQPQALAPSMGVFAYILIAGLLAVAGQIILKRGLAVQGALQLTPAALPSTLLSVALNPLVILGLAVTVSGTFFWLILLSRVDLSFAYPFASLNYVLILAASWWILGENLSVIRLLGVAAICLGVCLIVRTPARSAPASQQTPGYTPLASTRRSA